MTRNGDPDCYNSGTIMLLALQMKLPSEASLPALLRDWREDTMNFLRHDAPKIALVLIGAYVLTKILRTIARKSADLHVAQPSAGCARTAGPHRHQCPD